MISKRARRSRRSRRPPGVDTERAQNLSSASISTTQRQPGGSRYTSHDRTLSEPRDLYVTDVQDGDVGFRRLVVGVRPGSCVRLAGGGPATVVTKQPCSWWPARGEIRSVEASRQRLLWGSSERAVRSVKRILQRRNKSSVRGGKRRSRVPSDRAKAMERVKILEKQPGRTVRRMGSGTCAQPSTEQERSVCAPAFGGRGPASPWCPVGGEADKCSPRNGPRAQRKSAQVVVAMTGADNRTGPSEGPVARRACRDPGRRRGRGPYAPTRGDRLVTVRARALGWLANGTATRNAGHRLPGGTPCA